MTRAGEMIKNARNSAGVSTKQLAKKLGVSDKFLNEIECGKRILNEELIKKVEKILSVNLNDDIFQEINEPVENLKESEKEINSQWEEAFSNIIKKVPICDKDFKEIYDYKYIPIIDKKVEGFNPEKLLFIKASDDSMKGFRIQKNDNVMIFLNSEIVNNSISLVEVNNVRLLRQIKRLDSNKLLLISQYNDIKTETVDIKEIKIIGICIRLETNL